MTISLDIGEKALVAVLPEKIYIENAGAVYAELEKAWQDAQGRAVCLWLDAEGTNLITSAGLRIFMKLQKEGVDLIFLNMQPYVYEVFTSSGIDQMMDVYPAIREISIEGCRIIGSGKSGTVYRLDTEHICKVFAPRCTLTDVMKEKHLSRKVFQLGLPSAITRFSCPSRPARSRERPRFSARIAESASATASIRSVRVRLMKSSSQASEAIPSGAYSKLTRPRAEASAG